ncbi:MAG TPA: septum formation initiator family protein [Blastocatellia bacterium]|nr:septum formation initiator family protein [Blastocatellia bacterium]
MGQAVESYWNKRQLVPGARSMQAVAARHKLPSVILVMTAVMLILGCLSCYWRTATELNTALEAKQAEAARVADLQIQTQRLAARIERLKTDPRAVEALARQNLGFVRPGEIVLRIKPDSNSSEGYLAGSSGSPRHQQAGTGSFSQGTAAAAAAGANTAGANTAGADTLTGDNAAENTAARNNAARNNTDSSTGPRNTPTARADSSESNLNRIAKHAGGAARSKT